MYTEVLTDSKIGKVCQMTAEPLATVLGVWVTLLCRANDSPERGTLLIAANYPVTVEDLAMQCGIGTDTVEAILEQFKALCMIVQEAGVYHVTNWDKRQHMCFGRNRTNPKYIAWRKTVFERDNYTCKKCYSRGGRLVAHHIKRWADCENSRYDVDNGLTLCKECHKQEHRHRG